MTFWHIFHLYSSIHTSSHTSSHPCTPSPPADSLSQDSKTLMIVCISPVQYNAEESYCSLNFASRVATVELGKATRNSTAGPGAAKKSAK